VGAAQYRFSVPTVAEASAFGVLTAIDGIKVPGRRDVSFHRWTAAAPGGGTVLNVIMTAPDGVPGNQLSAFDMALVAGQIARAPDPTNYFAGSLQSALFYSVDGSQLAGLQAQVGPVQ
jgi:hypothetical protein